MSRAIDRLASIDSLERAWNSVSSKKGSKNSAIRTDADGLSINKFRLNYKRNLEDISRKIKSNNFNFSNLEPFFLKKPGTENQYRVICIPSITDRIVQRAILDEISPPQKSPSWLRNPLSYGFVPGKDRGVKGAALKACSLREKAPWVFKTDISKFFDKISRELLKEKIKEKIKKPSLHHLIFQAVDCEVEARTKGDAKKLAQQGIKRGVGLRQGMPLSPLLANLFLYEFDNLIYKKNINMVRYADDLIFFAESEEKAKEIHYFVTQELNKIYLQIPDLKPDSKTAIYTPEEGAEFLGVEIVKSGKKYQPKLTNKQQQSIREGYTQLSSLKECIQRGYDIFTLLNALRSKSEGYISAYDFCADIADLEHNLISWEISAKRKVYKELGVDVEKLGISEKIFLRLVNI